MNKQLLLNVMLLVSTVAAPHYLAGMQHERSEDSSTSMPIDSAHIAALSQVVRNTAQAYLAARALGDSDAIQTELLAKFTAAKHALAAVCPSESEDESDSDENNSASKSECPAAQEPAQAVAPQEETDASPALSDSDSLGLGSDDCATSGNDSSDPKEDTLLGQEENNASDNNNTNGLKMPVATPAPVVKEGSFKTIGIVVVGGAAYYRYIAPRLAKHLSTMKEGRMKRALSILTFGRKAA